MDELIYKRISSELTLPVPKIAQTAALLDEGNTVPFIARYRKEMTGGLSDEDVRLLQDKLIQYRNLEHRREEVMRLIDAQGALTEELAAKLGQAATVTEIDDLYRPYRPRKKTRASVARERGLEPLALGILEGALDPAVEANSYIDTAKELPDSGAVLQGAADIIAEIISDDAGVRKSLREFYRRQARVEVKKKDAEADKTYDHYDDFGESLSTIKSHRVLAINRGARENILSFRLDLPFEEAKSLIETKFVNSGQNESCRELILTAGADSFKRLLHPSLERECWQELLDRAVEGALHVFKENLRKRLLVPPVRRRRILGWDPGFRTGCKLACVSETGELLETATVYPTAPKNDMAGAEKKVLALLRKHHIDCIAIGNGTASRESEAFVAALIASNGLDLEYAIVNEAGASVYSASKTAQKEFPALDVAERSAVSIARRLQDPLAELVKIEPKAIGVGQYQHDMPPARMDSVLAGVVESCVNSVGVDLNSASAALLAYVAGINARVADRIVELRAARGSFTAREQLMEVAGLGPKVFKQCAGFLRLPESENYLERSAVHPESYDLAGQLMESLQLSPQQLGDAQTVPLLGLEKISALAAKLGAGIPTVEDILAEFRKPGRDPREDLPLPVFQQSITTMEDLEPGMTLTGIVRNIVDFGAFVDIGVHQDGLVHISEIADRYIKHPLDALQIEEAVAVKILSIDRERGRISLSIKQASP